MTSNEDDSFADNGTKTEEGGRQLRSKARHSSLDENGDDPVDSSLFRFDLNYEPPDYDRPLKIIYKGSKLNLANGVSRNGRPRQEKKMEKVEEPEDLDTVDEDPLKDDLYIVYHRMKGREEKRVQSIEREKAAAEVERMATQLDQLNSGNWGKYITQITHITNTNDKHEMELKRNWSMDELESYIQTYKLWKKRELEVKKADQDELAAATATSTPTPTRPSSKDKDVGHRSKIRKTSKKSKPFVSFYKNPTKRLKFDDLISRKCRRDTWAFGENLPDMKRDDYDIPDEWKTG